MSLQYLIWSVFSYFFILIFFLLVQMEPNLNDECFDSVTTWKFDQKKYIINTQMQLRVYHEDCKNIK